MSATAAGPFGQLAQRESGLIVPAHLRSVPEEPVADGAPQAGSAKDADGRRRIVLRREVRKRFRVISTELGSDDLGMVLWCKTVRAVVKVVKDAKTGEDVPVTITEPIPGACGEIMLREGEETDDPGFGCKCTRVHFTRF